MNNNRDLLKEAIADAKTVKETAIANAKIALEEAFTPYLKEKLAAKLSEMDEEDNAKERDELKQEEMEENFDMDESKKSPTNYGKINKNVNDWSDDYPKNKTSISIYGDDETEKLGGSMVDEYDETTEIDLDELLKELDEMDENINGTDVKDEDHELGDHGNIVNIDESEEDDDNIEDSEDEEINIEDMSEDDLKLFIEDVISDMIAAGELEAGHEGMENEESEESEEEINIDKILAELSERKKYGGNKGDIPSIKRGDKKSTAEEEGVEDYKKKLKEMEFKLNEAYNTIETVKIDLNEVNLLNAKLLYTNKIFRSKNLTESQKVKVLESFDKATNTKEVKLVFETLLQGVNEKKSTINESLIGGASKITGIAPKKPILEMDNQFARWQTLAGIKK
jgi:hypothetical protein